MVFLVKHLEQNTDQLAFAFLKQTQGNVMCAYKDSIRCENLFDLVSGYRISKLYSRCRHFSLTDYPTGTHYTSVNYSPTYECLIHIKYHASVTARINPSSSYSSKADLAVRSTVFRVLYRYI